MAHVTVKNGPPLLRLDMPPDALKEGNSGRLKLCSPDLLRSNESFQKANERLHARLGFTFVFRDMDHQAKEMCEGLLIRHMLDQLIEKQPAGHPS